MDPSFLIKRSDELLESNENFNFKSPFILEKALYLSPNYFENIDARNHSLTCLADTMLFYGYYDLFLILKKINLDFVIEFRSSQIIGFYNYIKAKQETFYDNLILLVNSILNKDKFLEIFFALPDEPYVELATQVFV